jgi:hypothetical protein
MLDAYPTCREEHERCSEGSVSSFLTFVHHSHIQDEYHISRGPIAMVGMIDKYIRLKGIQERI